MEDTNEKQVKLPQKKKLVPTDNKLQISMRKNLNSYIFLSKIFLKFFDEIELHALGQAVSMAAKLGERLQKFELGKMTKIETQQFTSEDQRGNDRGDRQPPTKVKIIITIQRDKDFFIKVDKDSL